MTDLLGAERGEQIVVGPTTVARLGVRILAASDVIAEFLPPHFKSGDPLHILLTLLVAAEEQREVAAVDLAPPGMIARHLLRRWIGALASEGWVQTQGAMVALTPTAHATLNRMAHAIYEAQRRLDPATGS